MSSPLIVLNALVIRADSQPPEAIRHARPKYNANRHGQGIEDPGVEERKLALTDKPQLEWEAFDEYWRKTHGPKILHVDGPSDHQTARLKYYLQQHRIPGGPTSERPPPYSAAPDAQARLVTNPALRCAPYVRPSWDGVAQLAYQTREDLDAFFDLGPGKYGDKIVPDEAVFIRGFGFHIAEEHLILNHGDKRRDPIILIKSHVRNSALTRAQFRGRWMAQHADVVKRSVAGARRVLRYAQLVNISQPGDRIYDPVGDRFDGMSFMSFANMNEIESFLASDAYAAIRADEIEFAQESAYFTALNYMICDLT
jgi:EthD domain